MKLSPTALILALSVSMCSAQSNPNDEPGVTKKSLAYHAYRLQETQPPFALKKVKALIAKIQYKEDKDSGGSSGTAALDPKVFQSLSKQAKFTYCMLHGEVSSQNCDGMPAVLSEESKLFAFPPGPFGEEADWSDAQRDFLHDHRGTVITLLRQTMRLRGRLGPNLKKAVIELDAVELFPDIVRMYKQSSKDHDLLTVLSVVMRDLKYLPYMKSDIFRKLYNADTNYKTSIPFTAGAAQTIISNAMTLFRAKKG